MRKSTVNPAKILNDLFFYRAYTQISLKIKRKLLDGFYLPHFFQIFVEYRMRFSSLCVQAPTIAFTFHYICVTENKLLYE